MNLRRCAAGLAAVTLAVTLAACGGDAEESSTAADAEGASESTADASADAASPEVSQEVAEPDDSGAADGSESDEAASATDGAWIDYAAYSEDPTAYADSDVVLFFYASWCPDCQETEASLDADGVPEGLTVVQVDFDSETELRQEYGVTVQHTFVHVDDEGAELKKWTGATTGAEIAAEL